MKKHITLYYLAQHCYIFSYVDVCSLYPWVCKYGEFPIGHPSIITENFIQDWTKEDYFGVIKCRVVPPRKLFHPLLPFRCNGKLLIPLCRTCAEQMHVNGCHHSDDERALDGAWVSLELYKAIKLGYKVLCYFFMFLTLIKLYF